MAIPDDPRELAKLTSEEVSALLRADYARVLDEQHANRVAAGTSKSPIYRGEEK